MSRTKIINREGLQPEQISLDAWPCVDENQLNETERRIFQKRKHAVDLYFQNKLTQDQIKDLTGINPRFLRRLINRCIMRDTNGIVWGYRALIPNKTLKPYELSLYKSKVNTLRKTGQFNDFLRKNPDIKDMIDDLYLGRSRTLREPKMMPKQIHKKFINACREKRIPPDEYPFNTDHMGYRAICRYLKKLRDQHFSHAASRFRHDAKQKARHSGVGEQNYPVTLTPYQKVQFDAHRIDAIFAINLTTPEGEQITRVLERLWVLTIIDVATRNVLSHSICLNKEYNASDVMQCVQKAVIPHKRMSLSIDGLSYHDTGGYPSEKFKELEWAVWDIIYFDNAKSHLSEMVKDRLMNLVGCTTSLGPVDMPMRRSFIERFFGTLTRFGFQRLPNTTGSHPNDPRRSNPEEKAIQYSITLEHLEELMDVIISNYNGTPHGGIYYQSPLELLEKRLSAGMFPRVLDPDKRSEMLFLQTSISRIVRGSAKNGKRPYIQYEGAEYRNDLLSNSAHLIGTELTLHVNVDDIRTVKAYLPDGSELGYLSVVGKWSISPHSLQVRKAINQLVNRKLLHYTKWEDPVFVYYDFLTKRAREGKKRATNRAAKVQKTLNKPKMNDSNQEEAQTLPLEQSRNEALEQARKLSDLEDITNFDIDSMTEIIKTVRI